MGCSSRWNQFKQKICWQRQSLWNRWENRCTVIRWNQSEEAVNVHTNVFEDRLCSMKRERSRMLLLGDHDWVRSKEAVWKWKYVLRKILRSVGIGIWPWFFMSLQILVTWIRSCVNDECADRGENEMEFYVKKNEIRMCEWNWLKETNVETLLNLNKKI